MKVVALGRTLAVLTLTLAAVPAFAQNAPQRGLRIATSRLGF
jgi:hypothetical protein